MTTHGANNDTASKAADASGVGSFAEPDPSALPVIRVAVLVSGSGSNLQSLIHTWPHQPKHTRLSLVVSNRPGVLALARATDADIPNCVIDHTQYATRDAFDAALHDKLLAESIDFIVLAGFMRILSPKFLGHWAGRIINIHPSLLPAYRGLNTHARALADGQREHGCTIHWVEPELDAGPIIAQAKLPIHPNETAEQLHQRVQQLEHKLYPLALHAVLAHQELPSTGSVCSETQSLRLLTEKALAARYTGWLNADY